MHKKVICFLIVLVMFFGCSIDKQNELNEAQKKALALFTKELYLPLKIDSTFIKRMETSSALNYKFLRAYFQNISNDSLSQEIEFPLERTCFIDSIKQTNGYQAFIDELDIGMIQNAGAYKLGKVQLKDKNYLLIWALCFTSYEACPIFSGTYIIGSKSNNEGAFTSVLLSKNYSVIDPPAFANRHTSAIINTDSLFIDAFNTEDDDMDVSGNTQNTMKYKYLFSNGEIKLVSKTE